MDHILRKDWFPYVFPFTVFLLLTEAGRWFSSYLHLLYLLKTLVVGSILYFYRKDYFEDFRGKVSFGEITMAIFVGLVSLAIWISPENYLPKFGTPGGFNPHAYIMSNAGVSAIIAIRILGASVVVPIMEELFWRSFLMRYLISHDFKKVPLGTYSRFSFLGVAVLFGLEHHRFIVGIVVGIFYNYLMIRERKLLPCIIAHSVTNLGLGIYVVYTGNWSFW